MEKICQPLNDINPDFPFEMRQRKPSDPKGYYFKSWTFSPLELRYLTIFSLVLLIS